MPSVRYANGSEVGAWDGRNRGRTKANRHSIQKTIQFIQMMGPQEEPFSAAPSTPTTHPDPRSFNLRTNRMDCKRGRCLVDFIIRYRLPAHSGPAWDAVDLFGRPIFLTPLVSHRLFSSSAQTSTTSPLKRKAPTELEMHSKPYMIKVRCSFTFRGRRFKKDLHGWLDLGLSVEPAVRLAQTN